jgi:hypothetical protein
VDHDIEVLLGVVLGNILVAEFLGHFGDNGPIGRLRLELTSEKD